MALRKVSKGLRLLGSPRYWRGLTRGTAAAIEHEKVLCGLLGCRTVVDIGANRGQFSLVANAVFPQAQIYAFEPLAQPAAIYRKVFAGNDRVAITQAAVGPTSGTVRINVSWRDDSSSILDFNSLQTEIFPGTGIKESVDIEIGPLQSFLSAELIRPPALLKLDVQGYELAALEGCLNCLKAFDAIYVECSFAELYVGQALASQVIGYLSNHGLRLCGVYNAFYDRNGQAIQADFMFRQKRNDVC